MKLLALAGSNSSTSINKKLAGYAARHFTKYEAELVHINDFPMPLFSVDLEAEKGSPETVDRIIEKINSCDFIVLSLAENNASYNVGFKNMFDWISRKQGKVFNDKPMLLMATSPGKRGGASVLEYAQKHLPRYGGNIKGVFSLPSFYANFDLEKGIINEELNNQLLQLIKNIEQNDNIVI
ncbi:MAG: NADPH-dependent FMN reductase [Bacteroidota bacterium]